MHLKPEGIIFSCKNLVRCILLSYVVLQSTISKSITVLFSFIFQLGLYLTIISPHES